MALSHLCWKGLCFHRSLIFSGIFSHILFFTLLLITFSFSFLFILVLISSPCGALSCILLIIDFLFEKSFFKRFFWWIIFLQFLFSFLLRSLFSGTFICYRTFFFSLFCEPLISNLSWHKLSNFKTRPCSTIYFSLNLFGVFNIFMMSFVLFFMTYD